MEGVENCVLGQSENVTLWKEQRTQGYLVAHGCTQQGYINLGSRMVPQEKGYMEAGKKEWTHLPCFPLDCNLLTKLKFIFPVPSD